MNSSNVSTSDKDEVETWVNGPLGEFLITLVYIIVFKFNIFAQGFSRVKQFIVVKYDL